MIPKARLLPPANEIPSTSRSNVRIRARRFPGENDATSPDESSTPPDVVPALGHSLPTRRVVLDDALLRALDEASEEPTRVAVVRIDGLARRAAEDVRPAAECAPASVPLDLDLIEGEEAAADDREPPPASASVERNVTRNVTRDITLRGSEPPPLPSVPAFSFHEDDEEGAPSHLELRMALSGLPSLGTRRLRAETDYTRTPTATTNPLIVPPQPTIRFVEGLRPPPKVGFFDRHYAWICAIVIALLAGACLLAIHRGALAALGIG
jgi:hypothetical protein